MILRILIVSLFLFCFKAEARNDYLNDGASRCGEVDLTITGRQDDYNQNDSSFNDNNRNSEELRLTFRKYLGTDCKTSKQNAKLKQQLELYKKCGSVNKNSALASNKNFSELVQYCKGIGAGEKTRPTGSLWEDLKKNYKKENPNVKTHGDK
tara:strand:- start:723 stop:1178 length:456 start_codon:yes stop_codon:yes gene_type:complete